jgi:hypothetical protein
MKTSFQGTCPICGKTFLRIELHAHILAENPPIRHATMKEITDRHPDWVLVRGACESCWQTHRELSQRSAASTVFTQPSL